MAEADVIVARAFADLATLSIVQHRATGLLVYELGTFVTVSELLAAWRQGSRGRSPSGPRPDSS